MRAAHAFQGTGAAVLCGALFLFLLPQVTWAQEDPVRIYNQACRLSQAGDQSAALERLRQAMAAGFDDLRFAEQDPDLKDLRSHPEFLPLLMAWSSERELQSSRRGIQLESGLWSSPRSLELVAGGAETVPPTLTLRWQPDGLQFRLSLLGEMARWPTDKTPPPWQGGPGLVLTLAIPDTSSPFESRNHFLLAFGLEKSTPVGAMYSDQLGWQRVLELDPEIQMNPGQTTLDLTGTIPWQAIQPYHPLADTRLGINAAVRVLSANLQAELFPDPIAFRPGSRARRYTPLTFDPESQTATTLIGKVMTSVNSGLPLELELVAVAPVSGPGTLTIDYTDNQGQTLLPEGQLAGAVNLDQGWNRWEYAADFSQLRSGLYTVRAKLDFPDQTTQVWSTRVLKLDHAWHQTMLTRIAALKSAEQPTASYYLRTLENALNNLPNRRDPGPIATTFGDLDRLLVRASQTGTLVPDQGTVLLIYPGPGGQDRLCTVYLPEGYRQRGPINPVVLLGSPFGYEPRLAQRIARSYEFEGHLDNDRRATSRSPIYLIPHASSPGHQPLEEALAEARAAVDWARTFFGTETFSLCGVDHLGAAALKLGADLEVSPQAMLIMAGRELAPWPQAQDTFIREKLAGWPEDLSLTWLDFVQETQDQGQGRQLLRVLKSMTINLAPVQEIRGGLSLTQVADRLVLWAESLP
jgi:hypothetical protein|nr:hypothetical protein [Candidatus Krumholzibacteria bacterium]